MQLPSVQSATHFLTTSWQGDLIKSGAAYAASTVLPFSTFPQGLALCYLTHGVYKFLEKRNVVTMPTSLVAHMLFPKLNENHNAIRHTMAGLATYAVATTLSYATLGLQVYALYKVAKLAQSTIQNRQIPSDWKQDLVTIGSAATGSLSLNFAQKILQSHAIYHMAQTAYKTLSKNVRTVT